MNSQYKIIFASALCSVLAVACAPKKDEEKQMPPQEQGEKKPDTFLSYPNDLEEQEKGETPSKQERDLQKNEDAVMNPLPG